VTEFHKWSFKYWASAEGAWEVKLLLLHVFVLEKGYHDTMWSSIMLTTPGMPLNFPNTNSNQFDSACLKPWLNVAHCVSLTVT